MSFPYLDLTGFRLRSVMAEADIQALDQRYPGWLQQNLNSWTSRINAQLRKRYGQSGSGDALPLGQLPPALVPAGTLPPTVTLLGRPTLGSIAMAIRITVGGVTPTFQWSRDGGTTWTAGGTVIGIVAIPLIGTGMAASFGIGSYSVDNVYVAAPPVPETVLQWLTILTTWDAYQKRGRNPQDPLILDLKEDRDRALAEVKEAADSKEGLFDLPSSEDLDSAVTTGGPLGYSETSPYAWTDLQAWRGRIEDVIGRGTSQ